MTRLLRRVLLAGGTAALLITAVGAAQAPTPKECGEGGAAPLTVGSGPGQLVVCLGAADQTVAYVGGNASPTCGAIVLADQLIIGDSAHEPMACAGDGAEPGFGTQGQRFQPAARSRRGAVAAGSEQAARAGARVIKRGGNALDAAVTATFADAVTRPEMCGIGGDGYLVYRPSHGRAAALDFETETPAAVHPTMLEGRGVDDIQTGMRVTGVPGVVAGLDAALERFGTIGLAQAIGPAERLARNGFKVSEMLETAYATSGVIPGVGQVYHGNTMRLRLHDEAARVYMPGGLPPQAGERMRLPDLARSLRLIAAHGPDAFYRGRIAKLIIAEMERSQSSPLPGAAGVMTAKDLASYRALWRRPVTGSYRGARIAGAPPPSVGGVFAVEMLNLLEGFPVDRHSSADRLHLLVEAQKIAWADRSAYIGDPEFHDVPTAILTSKDYAAQRRAEIDLSRAGSPGPGQISGQEPAPADPTVSPSHTIHISAVDRKGNAAAITCSVGSYFGNAVVPKGTGFLLNTQFPHGDGRDEVAPGRRRRTSMSPVIVSRHGRPVLAIGGAGSETIPMGVVQAIVNVVDHDMAIDRALDAARVTEPVCCAMGLETARVLPDVIAELRRRGHEIEPLGEYFVLPVLAGAGIDRSTGDAVAADDPRGEYAPAGARSP